MLFQLDLSRNPHKICSSNKPLGESPYIIAAKRSASTDISPMQLLGIGVISHNEDVFCTMLRSRMDALRPLLAQFPCAASLPATTLPALQDIVSSAFSSSFCAFLRVLPSETPSHFATLVGPFLPQATRSLSARPSRTLQQHRHAR